MAAPKKPDWTTWTHPAPPPESPAGPPAGPPPEPPARPPTGPPSGPPAGPLHGPSAPGPDQPPRNALGISALILGIVGLLTGLVPILFWLAAVLGVIALVLGLVGARRAARGYATNRRMSITGAVLGVLALALSVIGALIVNDAFKDLERNLSPTETTTTAPPTPAATTPEDDESAEPGKATTPATKGALDFGATQHYEDGVEVTVSAPRSFSPSDTAAGHSSGHRAVTVDITVRNNSDERLGLALFRVQAKDADGRTAERIFDSAANILSGLSGTVLPGRQAVATYAFGLPPNADASLDVEVRPEFDRDSAIWSGPTP
ncbi:DUF4190 domain-containing protein [Streptomyces sp. E11-3]|uniref:DUF4190 domain-containing protein n=1 Tax=Streptomyces sp. E11-3 TaxID=3110112 RepID=UPI00397F3A09